MKKIYFLILLSSCSFFVKAQYTITSASNPIVGDIETYMDLDSTGLFLGSSGVSQTWNYSAVATLPNPAITSTYVALSSVPNNSLFPTGTIAIDYAGGNYGVASINSTKFEYLGYATATPSDCWAYSDPYKIYSLPFAYGSISTDTYVLFQPTNITRGTLTTTGDGTGTLQLPTGTISNVLKLNYTIYEIDTASSGSVSNFSVSMNQYYASVSKSILLEVQTTTATVITGTNSSTTYNKYGRIYSTYATGINSKQNTRNFSVFPNPVTNGELFVSNIISLEKTTIEIYNVLGQQLKTISFENISANEPKKINVSNLPKGIYYLRISGKEIAETRKIIIE